MDHGDTAADERVPQRDGVTAGAVPTAARCGTMMQQRNGHGVQSWPQQFIRLVGSQRAPAPTPVPAVTS